MAVLCSALKAELLRTRPEGWEDSTEHPILDALLAHERLDDIIELLVDSLLLRLHAASRNHPPSTSTSSSSSSSSSLSVGSNKSEAAVFGLVEGLHLLCFSDDFAQRLIGHPLFREGHVLHSLVHVLTMSSEAVVASGLGLLSVLCEKQHPEFLAITHAHPSTRAILSALLALATRYLRAHAGGGSTQENGGGLMLEDTTFRRAFHCIELFADHPRYKTALMRPGAELLWDFLSVAPEVFATFLEEGSRRDIALHHLHLLVTLALPCPTASWDDITGGRAAEQGHAVLVNTLREMHAQQGSPEGHRRQAAERAVANLERAVGVLYATDNIHFPVEHLLTLHDLVSALRGALLPSPANKHRDESMQVEETKEGEAEGHQ